MYPTCVERNTHQSRSIIVLSCSSTVINASRRKTILELNHPSKHRRLFQKQFPFFGRYPTRYCIRATDYSGFMQMKGSCQIQFEWFGDLCHVSVYLQCKGPSGSAFAIAKTGREELRNTYPAETSFMFRFQVDQLE